MWGNSSQYLMRQVFVLQKRAVRYMCGAGARDSCRLLFVQHRILTLPSLYILETVSLMYKKVRHQHRENSYNTRQVAVVPLPIPHSALTKNSIFYSGRKIFNHLPVALRSLDTLAKFKSAVRAVLIQKAYYDVAVYFNDRML